MERKLGPSKESLSSSNGIVIVDTYLPGWPEVMPPVAHVAGNRYKNADIVRFRIAPNDTPSLLIVSPRGHEFISNRATVDRSKVNERMGKETNVEGQGPQFESLIERDKRREFLREKGKHQLLAHTVVGRMLSALPGAFGETLDNVADDFVASYVGREVDATTFAREYVQEAIYQVLFSPVFTREEVVRISTFIPESFTPFSMVAFLGEKVKPAAKAMYGKIYKERDELLDLIGSKTELALKDFPDSPPVRIWSAFYGEGLARFDDDTKAKDYAKINTASYLMTLFQAAADTTTGPGGNGASHIGREENQGLYKLIQNNEDAADAVVYVALALNSSLPADPHVLVEPLAIGSETFPAGTRVSFDLSSTAERELEEFTGMSVQDHSLYELVERVLEVSNEKSISPLSKALQSYAFKTGIKGVCMGNGLAVRELKALFKSSAGRVSTKKEGQQIAGLLLNRVNSSIVIK